MAKKISKKTNGIDKPVSRAAAAGSKRSKSKKAEVIAEDLPEKEVPVQQAAEPAAEKPASAEPLEAETHTRETAEPIPAEAEKLPAADPVEPAAEEAAPAEKEAPPAEEVNSTPRKSVAFIGSECYPFVKTGGLGDVMYALPKALVKQNCDVRVILPRYKCIPWEYQEKMVYRGAFDMDLCADGRRFYVGIMEYVWDGVVYDFIDNEEFFGWGNPYTDLVQDIPKYCYFAICCRVNISIGQGGDGPVSVNSTIVFFEYQ